MGHDARALSDELGAEAPDGAVGGEVPLVDGDGLGLEVLRLLHALERPEEVHGGGAAFGENFVRLFGSFPKDNPKGRSAADRRSTAYRHVANRRRDFGRGPASDVDGLVRKKALVEELE